MSVSPVRGDDLPRVPTGLWESAVPDEDVRAVAAVVLARADEKGITFDAALTLLYLDSRREVVAQVLKRGVVRPGAVQRIRALGALIHTVRADRRVA